MFTGLIHEQGKLRSIRRQPGLCTLEIVAPILASDLRIGDSVAVNGVCQTVTTRTASSFQVQARGDTLEKTTLPDLMPGSLVNLELAMRLGDRLDGHVVQGHVNGTADCLGFDGRPGQAEGRDLWLDLPFALADGVVAEGSIAVDGVSLTIAGIGQPRAGAHGLTIRLSVIPHTLESCTIGKLVRGQRVNIETDLLLRSRAMAQNSPEGRADSSGVSRESLAKWGYL